MNALIVEVSRLQFAITAMFHFVFVPLTLGLSLLLAIMETVFVITNKKIWKEMTQFWGMLFGINFAMGVATGITMEFQFGTNWAYYSQYVGDIFGIPLAIEGLMAFFLEGTFIGLFFFGWDRLSKHGHLIVTWLVAIGSNLSALWILIANGWMQNPVGAHFNFQTMRMEIDSFAEVFFNPVAQAKFVHTVSSGYVTGSIFVLALSAYYLIKKRNIGFAKRSITVAAAFGLASSLSVVLLGDESGYCASQTQHMKIAAIEGIWNTEKAPASFNLIGIPDQSKQEIKYSIKIPYALGLIATRSLDKQVPGINDLVKETESKITNGILAYTALQQLLINKSDQQAQNTLNKYSKDLGYALLLKRYNENVTDATSYQIHAAATDAIPHVAALFWSFRIMVACGFFFIFLFITAFIISLKQLWQQKWFLKLAYWSLPLPWLAAELGWFVAENGRQPWVIDGILPTFLGVSSLSVHSLFTSLLGFIVLYGMLSAVEIYLMVKYIRLGPEYLIGE